MESMLWLRVWAGNDDTKDKTKGKLETPEARIYIEATVQL